MKTKMTLLVIATCAIVQVVAAADPIIVSKPIQPSAANVAAKPKPVVFTPWNKLPVENTKIQRVGNISSRSWTQSVGWNPGAPSLACESDTAPKDQGMSLLWIGHEPWR